MRTSGYCKILLDGIVFFFIIFTGTLKQPWLVHAESTGSLGMLVV